MEDLNLESVELTTTRRRAPANGAASSSDYNATVSETLVDLSSIATFINERLRPILNALPAAAAAGMYGSTMYASGATGDPLFEDADGAKLTVAQVLANLQVTLDTLRVSVTEVDSRMKVLQTRLATTNQNDLRSAVQSIQDSVRALNAVVDSLNLSVSGVSVVQSKERVAAGSFDLAAGASADVEVVFNTAMPSDAYTVFTSTSLSPASVQVTGIVRTVAGVTVTVSNLTEEQQAGDLFVLAKSL